MKPEHPYRLKAMSETKRWLRSPSGIVKDRQWWIDSYLNGLFQQGWTECGPNGDPLPQTTASTKKLAKCGHIAYRNHNDLCIQDGCPNAAYRTPDEWNAAAHSATAVPAGTEPQNVPADKPQQASNPLEADWAKARMPQQASERRWAFNPKTGEGKVCTELPEGVGWEWVPDRASDADNTSNFAGTFGDMLANLLRTKGYRVYADQVEKDYTIIAERDKTIAELREEVGEANQAAIATFGHLDEAYRDLTAAREQIAALQARVKELERQAGYGTSWPAIDVMAKLADAADILLDRKSYDGHGWEEIAAAREAARAYSTPTTEK
jgi:hypothetical protein